MPDLYFLITSVGLVGFCGRRKRKVSQSNSFGRLLKEQSPHEAGGSSNSEIGSETLVIKKKKSFYGTNQDVLLCINI